MTKDVFASVHSLAINYIFPMMHCESPSHCALDMKSSNREPCRCVSSFVDHPRHSLQRRGREADSDGEKEIASCNPGTLVTIHICISRRAYSPWYFLNTIIKTFHASRETQPAPRIGSSLMSRIVPNLYMVIL